MLNHHFPYVFMGRSLRCEELQSAERVAGAEAALSVAAAAVKRWEVPIGKWHGKTSGKA